MKEIIIGKEGTQRFSIKNSCVSRQHAKITLDGGRWILEDLNSTNGTYIQNADGEFQQVKKLEISEFTRIALGATTATGFYFYAHHILEDEDKYEAEMRYTIELYEQLQREKEKWEAKNNTEGMLLRFLPPIISALSVILSIIFFPKLQSFTIILTSFTTAVSGYQQVKNNMKIKAIADKQLRIVRCPKCNRPLSAFDISNEQCPACKTHS